MIDIYFNESAQELLNKIERTNLNNVGGVFFELGWWVSFTLINGDFDFDQFESEEKAINFIKNKDKKS